MAVTAQEQVNPGMPEPGRRVRRPAAVWTRPSQLAQAAPILRLVSEIWAVPAVCQIGIRVDGVGIHVHVVLPDDDREAEGRITDAESNYLNATPLHNFDLMVTPRSRLPVEHQGRNLLLGFDTVLER